jgi:FkbM family methyltransferase
VSDLPALAEPYLGPNRVTVGKHGIFTYAAEDTVIGRALELYGEFGENEIELLLQLVKPGQTAVDVGANIGTVTVPLAKRVGRLGTVIAIEPQRRVFTLLCANIALNGLMNVRPIFAAAGAAQGTARIARPRPNTNHNVGNVSLNTVKASEEVSVVPLDSLELESCALVKIDVEGMEAQVLAGAAATIARLRPLIYFETKERSANTRSCIEFLTARNYALHWHISCFFNDRNFKGVKDDIFRPPDKPLNFRLSDINALAVPRESRLDVRLAPISGPDADWQVDFGQVERFGRV